MLSIFPRFHLTPNSLELFGRRQPIPVRVDVVDVGAEGYPYCGRIEADRQSANDKDAAVDFLQPGQFGCVGRYRAPTVRDVVRQRCDGDRVD